MDKVLKNVINNTIEKEFQSIMENYPECLKKNAQWYEEDKEYTDKIDKYAEELYKVLPKEYHHLVDELQESALAVGGIESRVAFKEGLILGVTDLSYLSEVGIAIAFI